MSHELIPIVGIKTSHGTELYNLTYENVYNGLIKSKYVTKEQLDKTIEDILDGFFDDDEKKETTEFDKLLISNKSLQSKNAELEAKIMELQARLLMLEPKEEIVEEKPKKKKKL